MTEPGRDPLIGIPYPSDPLKKALYKSPILLWRLGLGPLIGRLFMILTTTGRTSGLPRRTAIEYRVHRGRKYVLAGWGEHSQWYRNILADPHITIQTAGGAQSVTARRVTDDAEMAEAYGLLEENPAFRRWVALLGLDVSREEFVARKGDFFLVTFDPTTAPTPPPLEADLRWVWLVVAVGMVVAALARRRSLT